MLQDIRDNAQSTVAKVIVGLIVLTFALFGVDSIVGGFGGEPEVAIVNGSDIKETEFLRAVDIKKRQILNQMGENADPSLIDDQLLKKSVLEGLIDQEILLQDAVETGLFVSEQSIDGLITGINQFQVDGKFDNNLFLASIRNFGMTTRTFKDSIKKEVMISQPRNAIVSTSFLLDDEFERVIKIDRQTRNYSVAKFSQSDYLDSVSVDEGEVQEYYDSNKSDFTTVETVDVEYLELDKNQLADQVTISDEELARLYQAEVEDFEAAEERNASHILIEVSDEVTDAQAKEKAEDVVARLAAGESFESLAKELSDDIGSASQGGSLGFAAKGAYLPAFEDALFALEEGQVSQPVLTEYGYHLIKLIETQVQPVPSFEEMRFALEADAKSEKAEAMYVELSEQLADSSYSSSDLAEPSEVLGLEIQTGKNISLLSREGVLSNPKVKKALFSEDVLKGGNNSELIEISSDTVLVVRVATHYPESQKPIDEVRNEIVKRLKADKATLMAAEAAKNIIATIKGGQTIAGSAGIDWVSFLEIKRNDLEQEPEILKLVFSMSEENSENISLSSIEVSGDYYVVKLDRVNVPDTNIVKDEERKAIARMVGSGIGNAEYQVFQTDLKSKASIEKI